jgi:hypothetical protein
LAAAGASSSIPFETDALAVKHAIGRRRTVLSKLQARFQRVKTDLKTTVEEESKAHDFSREGRDSFGRLALSLPESGLNASVGSLNARNIVSSTTVAWWERKTATGW